MERFPLVSLGRAPAATSVLGKPLLVLSLVLVLLVVASGCIDGGTEAPVEAQNDSEMAAEDESPLPITVVSLETTAASWEADVLCLGGGAPILPRVPDNRVAEGVSVLEVEVAIPESYTATQVGFVVDSNNAAHAESNNKTIAWLPQVLPGEEETFVVDVEPEDVEDPGQERWGFYQRMQPPGVDQACYTGGGIGVKRVTVTALP